MKNSKFDLTEIALCTRWPFGGHLKAICGQEPALFIRLGRCSRQIRGYINICHKIGSVKQLINGHCWHCRHCNGNRDGNADRGWRHTWWCIELPMVKFRCKGTQQETLNSQEERINGARNNNDARYDGAKTYNKGDQIIAIVADNYLQSGPVVLKVDARRAIWVAFRVCK